SFLERPATSGDHGKGLEENRKRRLGSRWKASVCLHVDSARRSPAAGGLTWQRQCHLGAERKHCALYQSFCRTGRTYYALVRAFAGRPPPCDLRLEPKCQHLDDGELLKPEAAPPVWATALIRVRPQHRLQWKTFSTDLT